MQLQLAAKADTDMVCPDNFMPPCLSFAESWGADDSELLPIGRRDVESMKRLVERHAVDLIMICGCVAE